ncbi:ESPR-type extended signal peptide-containing protein [Variovorax ginsengisoli]
MNHAYRLIWSDALCHHVRVPEGAWGQGKEGGTRLPAGAQRHG